MLNTSTDKSYNDLRLEYNRISFKRMLREVMPPVCGNCGSDENVEYHHIVPLSIGGTNRLTNIVPLCNRCHKAFHCGQHISKYKNTENMGRPRKATLTPEVEEILWDWANGKIGHSECKELLGYSKSTHIKDIPLYRDFIKKNGIKNVKNTLDILCANGKPRYESQVSVIAYADSNVTINYYGTTGDDFE